MEREKKSKTTRLLFNRLRKYNITFFGFLLVFFQIYMCEDFFFFRKTKLLVEQTNRSQQGHGLICVFLVLVGKKEREGKKETERDCIFIF